MADEVDQTADRDEREAPARLAASKRPEGPKATGCCLFCETPLADAARWCDKDCQADWARVQHAHLQRPR